MKKLLSLALITTLLLGSAPVEAKHHNHAGGKVLSGVWQMVKIGGGLFMMAAGTTAGSAVCCGGCVLGCCQENCGPNCEFRKNEIENIRKCGTIATVGGGAIGFGGIYLGYRSIKSGIHGLRMLARTKHKKYKKHKKHHHHAEVCC